MDTEQVTDQIVAQLRPLIKQYLEELGIDPRLYRMEKLVHPLLRQLGQLVVQAAVTTVGSGLVGPERPCGCGGQQRYVDQHHPRTHHTSVGDVTCARRARYRCATCGLTTYPVDALLEVRHAGQMSRYLQEHTAWLLQELSCWKTSEALERFWGQKVSPSQVLTHAQALGAELDQQQQERVQAVAAELVDLAAARPPRQVAQAPRLYVAPDGFMYCTTERDPATGARLWREMKVAAVYEGLPAEPDGDEEPDPRRARDRIAASLPTPAVPPTDTAQAISYVIGTATWQAFGPHLLTELWARGLRRPVTEVVVVADGAPPIDEIVETQLRQPGVHLTRILDYPHAVQHLWVVARLACKPDSERVAWMQAPLQHLERGEVELVAQDLQAVAQATDDPDLATVAQTAAAYFLTRYRQIDYPAFVAQGYQIGSGLAESACRRFGTDRLKGTGMAWTVPGAQKVATLRLFALSDRWPEVSRLCGDRPAA